MCLMHHKYDWHIISSLQIHSINQSARGIVIYSNMPLSIAAERFGHPTRHIVGTASWLGVWGDNIVKKKYFDLI